MADMIAKSMPDDKGTVVDIPSWVARATLGEYRSLLNYENQADACILLPDALGEGR